MKFECPHCDQSLETETLYKGSGTVCPSCGGNLTIPSFAPDGATEGKPESEQSEESPETKEDFRMDFTAAKKVIQDNLKNDSLSLHQALTERGIQQEDVDLDKTASGSLTSSPTDRYVIGDAITQGGMGAILDAKDVNARRNVAMKVILRPEQASNEDILRFVREGQVLAQLEHPGIVPLHEVGVDAAGNPFFTMKKVVGLNLGEILRKLADGHKKTIKDYPLSHLLNIFQRVCDAIAFAHSKRVIHRDLKPENIMIGEYGEVLVIDWGIAKILSRGGKSSATQDLTDTGRSERVRAFIDSVQSDDSGVAIKTMDGELMGTPRFMAPEQATGELEKIDDCTDIYALGAILYNILTLHPPITGENLDEMLKNVSTGKIKHPSSYNTTKKWKTTGRKPQAVVLPHCPGRKIPDALGAVAMKALSLDPKDRYQYVKFLQRDLEAYQTGFATSVEAAGLWKQVKLFVGRHKVTTAAAAIIFLLVTVGSIVSTSLWVSAEKNKKVAVENEKEARKALHSLKGTAPALVAQSRAFVENNHLVAALKTISYATTLVPESAEYKYLKGNVLQSMLKLKAAAEQYEKALKLDPKHELAKTNLNVCRQILAEHKGKKKLPTSALCQLYVTMRKQDRFADALSTIRHVDSETTTLATFLRSVLEEEGVVVTSIEADEDGWCSLDLGRNEVEDLSPLKGLPLTSLIVSNPKTTDLSPLKGMPLTNLSIGKYGQNIHLNDLSPLRGMPLVSLRLINTHVSDISPLKGMPLVQVSLSFARISNLSALKGMPLTSVNLQFCRGVSDLSPLKGMDLTDLSLYGCPLISDLSPLKGMPLTSLDLIGCRGVTDLTPLKGMPLTRLFFSGTKVSDLTPLKGMDLTWLRLDNSPVTDLAPLKGMTLKYLLLNNSKVSDLTPLKGMPLTYLYFTPENTTKGIEVVREMKSLTKINTLPPAEFWEKYDAGEFNNT